MPIEVVECWDSGRITEGEQPSLELRYNIFGATDSLQAKLALREQTPVVANGLVRESYGIEQRLSEDAWLGSVRYGKRVRQPGQYSVQFETAGGTQRITQSIQTVARYAPPGQVAPDFHGAVGVTEDAVDGVDVIVPVYEWAETHCFPDEAVTRDYTLVLFWLTGRVNQGRFRGFATGEVLFKGASGSKRGDENWEITFRFAASPNVVGLQVAGMTIEKKGWEYLWFRYAEDADQAAKALVKRPIAAYVEQVYEYGDFSALEIGN